MTILGKIGQTYFCRQKLFCQSGFYREKNWFFHLPAKTCQPCSQH